MQEKHSWCQASNEWRIEEYTLQINELVMHMVREVTMEVRKQKVMQQPDITNQRHAAKATRFSGSMLF